MKNDNSTLKLVLAIVGGVVVLGAIAVGLIHFWDDIKKILPGCCKDDDELLEITPKNLRMRKRQLDHSLRAKARSKGEEIY